MLRSLETLRPCQRNGRAVTLVELLVALAVVAVLSTAVATMLVGAGHTNQYVNNETDAMSQVENAYRRIMHNVRTTSVAPTVTGGNDLVVKTQPDSANGFATGANVEYKLSGGALVEIDDRYGTSTLLPATMSPSFSVSKSATSSPTQVTITVTAYSGTAYAVSRTAIITCRNF